MTRFFKQKTSILYLGGGRLAAVGIAWVSLSLSALRGFGIYKGVSVASKHIWQLCFVTAGVKRKVSIVRDCVKDVLAEVSDNEFSAIHAHLLTIHFPSSVWTFVSFSHHKWHNLSFSAEILVLSIP